jgi:hypothetical protein
VETSHHRNLEEEMLDIVLEQVLVVVSQIFSPLLAKSLKVFIYLTYVTRKCTQISVVVSLVSFFVVEKVMFVERV